MNNIISNKLDTNTRFKKYQLLNINSNKPNKLKLLVNNNNDNDGDNNNVNKTTHNYKVENIENFISNIAKFSDFLSNKEGIQIIIENININFNSKNNTILLNYGLFYKFIMGIVKLINIERIYDSNQYYYNNTINNKLYININTIYNRNKDINLIITNITEFDKYINNNSISWNNINLYNCYNKSISSLIKVIQNYSNITQTSIQYYTSKIIINNNVHHVYAFLIKLNNTTIHNNISLYSENCNSQNYDNTDCSNNTNSTITTLLY